MASGSAVHTNGPGRLSRSHDAVDRLPERDQNGWRLPRRSPRRVRSAGRVGLDRLGAAQGLLVVVASPCAGPARCRRARRTGSWCRGVRSRASRSPRGLATSAGPLERSKMPTGCGRCGATSRCVAPSAAGWRGGAAPSPGRSSGWPRPAVPRAPARPTAAGPVAVPCRASPDLVTQEPRSAVAHGPLLPATGRGARFCGFALRPPRPGRPTHARRASGGCFGGRRPSLGGRGRRPVPRRRSLRARREHVTAVAQWAPYDCVEPSEAAPRVSPAGP